MKKVILSESEFNNMINEATKMVVNEKFNDILKTLGYGALGTAALGATIYGNDELHQNDEPDPMETSVKASVDDFRRQNLEDKVKAGEISYEDALEMFKNGKGYANESVINRIIGRVINESLSKIMKGID